MPFALQTPEARGVESASDRERGVLRLVLVGALLCWAWIAIPLLAGRQTLFVRDVMSIHFPLKAFGAAELRAGHIPAFMPSWGLGQPFRGNPQALAFYPGNVLYLLLPFLSAFNAHFVLHWLLALGTMGALARALGQSRAASLLAGLAYAGGGVLLSSLSFYNLLTVLAWWPLAMLGAVRGGRAGLALGGLACGMALLGGEPVTALLGMAPLLLVASGAHGWRRGAGHALAVGGLGLLVAAPQIVATLRILPSSFRAEHGIESEFASSYALHPLRLLELVLPLPFGWPGRGGAAGFWAKQITPRGSFFYSMHFGIVALWLAAGAARRRSSLALLALAGLALSWLGGVQAGALVTLTGGLFRFPEKFLVLTALCAPLLAGFGLDHVRDLDVARRAARRAAWAAALALAAALAVLLGRAWWLGEPGAAFAELVRVQGLRAGIACALAGVLLLLGALALRRGRPWLLVALQLLAVLQLFPLLPRVPTDIYRQPPAWLATIAPARSVHSPQWSSPVWQPVEPTALALTSIAASLAPAPGILYGLSYPLGPDFEGMGSSVYSLLQRNLSLYDWERRLRWCRALGVEFVVAFRALDSPLVELVERRTEPDVERYLYRVRDPAPFAWWPRTVSTVEGPIAAVVAVTRAEDPIANVVVARAVEHAAGGTVAVQRAEADEVVLEVEGPGGLALVRRAYSPLWRARSDTASLTIQPANLDLVGVAVPAGKHRVNLEVSAWPEALAGSLALLVAGALVWLWRRA